MSLITLRKILNITNTGIGFTSVSRFQNLLYSNKINHFYNNCHGGYKYYSNSTPIKYSSPDFSMSKLSNGIRVATKNMGSDNKSNFITFGLFVDSGVTKEDTGKNGVAHFLEHLMFKGTYKRSKKEIESEIENLGAHLNAYTSREQTVYQIRCFVNDVPKCMDILSDIIKNSKLCKKSIENEREVIIREMEEVYKSEEEGIFDELHSEFYKNNPLGNTILGPKENIISINRRDLINYIRSNYIPNNMVILAIGNIDHEYFKGIANHYFNDINGNDDKNDSSTKIHCSEKIPVIIQKRGKHDGKLHIVMGYNGCSLKSIDLPKLMLLKIILGEYTLNEHKNNDIYNSSSNNKITQGIISDIKKYIESFEVFNTCYKDTGIFGWYLKCNNNINKLNQLEVKELTNKIHDRIRNLHANITEEDLKRAKRILSYQIASVYENSLYSFDEIGRDITINKRYIDVNEKLNQIKDISIDDINNIIGKYFNYSNFNYVIKK